MSIFNKTPRKVRILTADLAIRRDRVAIVVGDVTPVKNALPTVDVIIAERLRQGAPEPEIQTRIIALIELMKPDRVALDASGLGDTIVSNIKRELKRRGNKTQVTAVKIMGTGEVVDRKKANISKEKLFGDLLSLVEHSKITYGKTARESKVLHSELSGLRVAIVNGKIRFGNDVGPIAERTSDHDDYATAMAFLSYFAIKAVGATAQLVSPVSYIRDMVNDSPPAARVASPDQPEFIDGATADALRDAKRRAMGRNMSGRGTAAIYSQDMGSGGPNTTSPRNRDGSWNITDGSWPDRR